MPNPASLSTAPLPGSTAAAETSPSSTVATAPPTSWPSTSASPRISTTCPSARTAFWSNAIYQEIVASGSRPLILDCGANIGCNALWFTARYPQAHIVAIEPAADNFEILAANCAGLDIDCRQAGVSAADGTARLSDPGGGGMGYRTADQGDGPEVAMISIKTLLASKPASSYTPFLLKLDIEGAEKSLFDHDAAPLAQFPLIILEPHDWLLPGQLSSQSFFRFHAAANREFCMKHENVASIIAHPTLRHITTGLKN